MGDTLYRVLDLSTVWQAFALQHADAGKDCLNSLFRRLQGFIPANKAAVGQLKPLRNIVFKYRNGILPGSLCGGLLLGDGCAACQPFLLQQGLPALIRQGVPGIIDGGIGIIGR